MENEENQNIDKESEEDKFDEQRGEQREENIDNLVTVFTTDSQGIAAAVISILEEAGINYVIKGEGVQSMYGIGSWYLGTSNPMTEPNEFQVMEEDAEKALELLKDVDKSEPVNEPNLAVGNNEGEIPDSKDEGHSEVGYEGEEEENTDFLVAVLRTDSQVTAAVARSILDEAGIEYLVKGEGIQNLVGYGIIGQVYNELAGLIEFQVMPDDEQLARELLKDIEESPGIEETNIIDESIPENDAENDEYSSDNNSEGEYPDDK